jgi:signal transduction histidine kinase
MCSMKSSMTLVALLLFSAAACVATGWWSPLTLLFALAVMPAIVTILAKHWRQRIVAEERARFADEIHDTLSAGFAGIGFQLQAIRHSVPPNCSGLERQVDLAIELTRSSHEEARRSIANLRPEAVGPGGLLPALRACAERMISGAVKVETYCGDEVATIPEPVNDTMFRIGQEAIANSIRHAGPSTIRIRVHHHRSSICLSVEDDGAGFATDRQSSGLGLAGMVHRAESISATLVVRSAPGLGTRVEVRAPLKSRFEYRLWRILQTYES